MIDLITFILCAYWSMNHSLNLIMMSVSNVESDNACKNFNMGRLGSNRDLG